MHQSYLADELVAAIGPSIYAVLGEIQADVVSITRIGVQDVWTGAATAKAAKAKLSMHAV